MVSSIGFFVTAGRGTERFVAGEIKDKILKKFGNDACMMHETMTVQEGKIYFRVDAEYPCDSLLKKLLSLKSVERLFIAIKDYNNSNFIANKRIFLNKLMKEISTEENFSEAKNILSQQVTATSSQQCLTAMPSEVSEASCQCLHCGKDSFLQKANKLILLNKETTSKHLGDKDSLSDTEEKHALSLHLGDKDSLSDTEEKHALSLHLKNNESKSLPHVNEHHPTLCSKRTFDELYPLLDNDSINKRKRVSDDVYSVKKESVLSQGQEKTCNKAQRTESDIEQLSYKLLPDEKQEKTLFGEESRSSPTFISEQKLFKLDSDTANEECAIDKSSLTFRMSIKCSGKVRRWLDIRRLSKDISWRVTRATGWKVQLSNPNIEVCVHISDENVTIGVPLTKYPLSRRNYIVDPGLRTPVAWIMAQLACLKPNHKVLDPMCGKGTLLLEACSSCEDAQFWGVDKCLSQVNAAVQNVKSSGYSARTNLVQANGLALPFKDKFFDAVLCDAPFNQKHLTQGSPEQFYLSFLTEIYRVLAVSSRFILLTSQELHTMLSPHLDLVSTKQESNQAQPHLETPRDPHKDIKGEEHTDCVQIESTHFKKEEMPLKNFKFLLLESHYVKLGETHASIMVMQKL